MFKNFLLLTVSLLFMSVNIYPQMQNKWAIVDSLEVFQYPGYPDYYVYFQIKETYNNQKSISYADKDNIAVIASWRVDEPQYIIRKTSDGGACWRTIYRDTTQYINNSLEMVYSDIHHPAENKIILTGYHNYSPYQYFIKYTDDLFETWNIIEFDTNCYVRDLCMLDSSFGVVVGGSRGNEGDSLYITYDGLRTFQSIGLPSHIKNCNGIVCLSENNYILISNNYESKISSIYKTEDGGKHWAIINTPRNEYIIQMKFIDENTGFVRYSNYMYRTDDGGKTWESIVIKHDDIRVLNSSDFDFADNKKGIIISTGFNVYLTEDGGENWIKEDIPYKECRYSAVIYPAGSEPIIAYRDYFLCKRTEDSIFKSPKIDLTDYSGSFVLPKGNKISWENIENASHYQLYIHEQNYTNLETQSCDTIVSDTSIVLDLNYQCQYYFQIRAFNESLSSEISGQQFVVYTVGDSNEIPSPKILYPRIERTGYPSEFTAYWTTDTEVDTFDIELYKSDPFHTEERLLEITRYPDTSIALEGLLSDTAYFFKVRCRKNDKVSRWSSKQFYILAPVSTEEIKYTEDYFEITPNPVNNSFTAVIKGRFDGYNKIENIGLFDIYGRAIKTPAYEIFDYVDGKRIKFDVSTIMNGIYFLIIRYNGVNHIGKFMIYR
jgi:hypothetical protein